MGRAKKHRQWRSNELYTRSSLDVCGSFWKGAVCNREWFCTAAVLPRLRSEADHGIFENVFPPLCVALNGFFCAMADGLTPPARSGHCCVVYKDEMIIWGGEGADDRMKNDMWSWSLGEFTSTTAHVSIDTNRSMPSFMQTRCTDQHCCFAEHRTWRHIVPAKGSPVPDACEGHTVVLLGSDMFVFGGNTIRARLNTLWRFSFGISSSEACASSVCKTPHTSRLLLGMQIPSPGLPCNRRVWPLSRDTSTRPRWCTLAIQPSLFRPHHCYLLLQASHTCWCLEAGIGTMHSNTCIFTPSVRERAPAA